MSNSVRESIAAEVRAVLARHDKSQRDLAGLLGIDQASAWARLRARRSFRAEEVALIAAWVDEPIGVLIPVPARSAA